MWLLEITGSLIILHIPVFVIEIISFFILEVLEGLNGEGFIFTKDLGLA
jgi:hypothetical protein